MTYFSKERILILLGLFQSNAPCIQRLYLLFRANAGCFFRKVLKSLFGLIYPLQQFDGIQLNNILKTLNLNTFKGMNQLFPATNTAKKGSTEADYKIF